MKHFTKGAPRGFLHQGAALAAAAAASLFLLTGCGAGSAKSSNAMDMAAAETMAAAAVTEAPMAAAGAWDSLEQEAGIGFTSAETADEAALSSAVGSSLPAASNRKLIRNVNMSVETTEFDSLLQTVNAKITALGGYAEQSEVSGSRTNYYGEPIPRYASITARIPADQLDSFVAQVETSGNVISKSETTEDITLRYSDVESRKKSLEIEQERIWALLEKADTLEAVISLEERLSEIRYELESMTSQLRLYDNQVDYSTVWISVSEIINDRLTPMTPLTASQRIQNGFQDNLNRLGTMLTDFVIGLIVSSPFWFPVVIICFVVWKILKKRASRSAEGQTKRSYFHGFRKGKKKSGEDPYNKN